MQLLRLYEGGTVQYAALQVSVIAITLIPFDFMQWDISVILLVSDRALKFNVQILKSRS